MMISGQYPRRADGMDLRIAGTPRGEPHDLQLVPKRHLSETIRQYGSASRRSSKHRGLGSAD
jgi:hypothetical protein